MPLGAPIPISGEAPTLLIDAPAQLPVVVVSSLHMSAGHAAELVWIEHVRTVPHNVATGKAETNFLTPSMILHKH